MSRRAGAIPTGNMTHAAANAKFRWVLARVRQELAANTLRLNDKLSRVERLMATPYIDEMDAFEGTRSEATDLPEASR